MNTAPAPAAVRSVAPGESAPPATARTVITYDNPAQAGFESWPAVVIKNGLPAAMKGELQTGDFTQEYRQTMANRVPGIWDRYAFGHEPRTRVIEERYEFVPPADSPQSAPTANSVAESPAVLGFTYGGPHIRFIYQDSFSTFGYTWASYRAGLELDWAVGLRLPLSVNLTAPDVVTLGEPYQATSAVSPLDWSAQEYGNAGILPEGGNEFVLRENFFIGLRLILFGRNLCPQCSFELNSDVSSSFATPFGTGSRFPIPTREDYFRPIDVGPFSFQPGLLVTANLTSTRITADWSAVPGSDCRGFGTLTFREPGEQVALDPVACNLSPTDAATVQVTNLRYFFNQFNLRLTGLLRVRLFGSQVLNARAALATVDLSRLTGGLSVGSHVQCTFDFRCERVGPDDTVAVSSTAVDRAAPAVTAVPEGTLGSAGWYRSDVAVTLQTVDLPADCGVGVRSTQYRIGSGDWQDYVGPFTISEEGSHTVAHRATDIAGNESAIQAFEVLIDKTAPAISGAATTRPNAAGWHNKDVTVHFEASDEGSGISSVSPDQVISDEGADQGVQGRAVDIAGNEAQVEVGGINLDKTAPAIVISSPAKGKYANTAAPTAQWAVSDALSGVARQGGSIGGAKVGNGAPIDLLLVPAGHSSLMVKATDQADNRAKRIVRLTVTANVQGLSAVVRHMCDTGLINKPATCRTLKHDVFAAIRASQRGDEDSARSALTEFLTTVQAQTGKSIRASAAEVLLADARWAKAHL